LISQRGTTHQFAAGAAGCDPNAGEEAELKTLRSTITDVVINRLLSVRLRCNQPKR
jgi:hypothetical protein